MKFALLILLISASLSYQSEALIDRFVISGKIICTIPGIKNVVKAVELWESDGFWPFHGVVDDHLKANVTFHEVKPETFEFTIEMMEMDLLGGYELYVRVLSHCAFDRKPKWTDFDLKGSYSMYSDKDRTHYYPNTLFYINRWNKRSVSGHDDNQH